MEISNMGSFVAKVIMGAHDNRVAEGEIKCSKIPSVAGAPGAVYIQRSYYYKDDFFSHNKGYENSDKTKNALDDAFNDLKSNVGKMCILKSSFEKIGLEGTFEDKGMLEGKFKFENEK